VGRVNGGSGMIRALRLKIDGTGFKNGTVRVHLFRDTPVVTVGDNGVLNSAETYAFTEAAYMGYCDVVLAQQTSDGYVKGFGVRPIGGEWNFDCPAGVNYINALLEARTAATPAASRTFTLVAETLQN
jgi:predicted ATP-grasp superfamily ATP-dependent carboligase